jgi:hypothetical protein
MNHGLLNAAGKSTFRLRRCLNRGV